VLVAFRIKFGGFQPFGPQAVEIGGLLPVVGLLEANCRFLVLLSAFVIGSGFGPLLTKLSYISAARW